MLKYVPADCYDLPKKFKDVSPYIINLEKKLFHDVIYEGREILEFGDSFIENSEEKYIFEDPEFDDLVFEFEQKANRINEGDMSVISTMENPKIMNYILESKGLKKRKRDLKDFLDDSVCLNDSVMERNEKNDRASMRFDLILNLKQ